MSQTYIATTASPVYVMSTDGFFKHTGRTLPTGTEITIASKGIDDKSNREVGYLASGEIVYLDRMQPVIVTDAVVVQSTRLWDWVLYAGLAGGAIGYGIYKYRQHKKKKK